jgi:hypothetical protein
MRAGETVMKLKAPFLDLLMVLSNLALPITQMHSPLLQGSFMAYFVHNGLQYPQCKSIVPPALAWYIHYAWVLILIAVLLVITLLGLVWYNWGLFAYRA